MQNIVRTGLIQWRMRPFSSLEELLARAEQCVDALVTSGAEFALFPEFFSTPLLATFTGKTEAEAMRVMAELTPVFCETMSKWAVQKKINILTGSMPVLENGILKNVGYVCHRNGKTERYEKLHITPHEVSEWNVHPGNLLRTYETDCGKIGVLICYDSEFPELGRLLSDEGMHILFVPFMTDTESGYHRVRRCAQARAVENECYVAITGSVGSLPATESLALNYSRAAIFTPCDHFFPADGILAELPAEMESVLTGDVDLSLLRKLHTDGSVHNLRDRRTDFYSLQKKHS